MWFNDIYEQFQTGIIKTELHACEGLNSFTFIFATNNLCIELDLNEQCHCVLPVTLWKTGQCYCHLFEVHQQNFDTHPVLIQDYRLSAY